MGVYMSVLQPGDTVLGMDLSHGGHLTHGHPLSFSGKLYNFIPYGVRKDTETIDYEALEGLMKEHKPKLVVVGASAYPRFIDFPRIWEMAERKRRPRHGGHGPHRGPRGGRRAPLARALRPLRDDHHAQDPARPPGRAHPLQGGVRQGPGPDRLPGHPGRPPRAHHRRQGRGPSRGRHARVQGLRRAGRGQRQGPGRRAGQEGAGASSRAAPTTTSCSWTSSPRASRARRPRRR